MNNAPNWARGTFVWRMCLADEPNALEEARRQIAAMHYLLDGSVRQLVFIMGVFGMDSGALPWDGSWPYWNRLTYRVNHDRKYLSDFMLEMRDRYNAQISFHVNLTDANVGMAYSEETRAFFEKLRANRCLFVRDKGINAHPWFGLPHVPDHIPVEKNTMDAFAPGDASDIFALVDYKQFWDSGLAREMIDEFFSRLPYVPPVLYLDVLNLRGWCIHPGYPDGKLGHSRSTQIEGRQNIVEHVRRCGSEVGVEVPETMDEVPTSFGHSHGGLASNDYSRICGGFGMGNKTALRDCKGMQVYGNQGGYHFQCGPRVPELLLRFGQFENGKLSPARDHLREWGDVNDIAAGFYLAAIQELYHIGKGNCRLPRSAGYERLDDAQGRARLDCITLAGGNGFSLGVEAESSEVLGSCSVQETPWASGGKTIVNLHEALGNGVAFAASVPAAGQYDLFIRYSSAGGGVLDLRVNEAPAVAVELADTADWDHYGDHLVSVQLRQGLNRIEMTKGRIFARWDDGTAAQWDRDGFLASRDGIVFGRGFDRMWPDTWSGQQKVYFFSWDGCRRPWRLPLPWAGATKATLHPLTPQGRGAPLCLEIKDGAITPDLQPRTPYVLTLP